MKRSRMNFRQFFETRTFKAVSALSMLLAACLLLAGCSWIASLVGSGSDSSADSSATSSSDSDSDSTDSATVKTPVISVSGSGIARTVTISCATSGAAIYYTTDGTTPTANSSQYGSGITIAGLGVSRTIEAIAIVDSNSSAVASSTVTIAAGSALSLSGTASVLAGSGDSAIVDGTGTAASFAMPAGITSDGTFLYVADSSDNGIRRINISTGETTTPFQTALSDITTDGIYLYGPSESGKTIQEISIASGEAATLAGSGSTGSDDGTGTAASFYDPFLITIYGDSLYVVDNYAIRRIVISSGEVSTLIGHITSTAQTNGTGDEVYLGSITSICADGSGNLYIIDNAYDQATATRTRLIRKINIDALTATTVLDVSASPYTCLYKLVCDGSCLYAADNETNEIFSISISSGSAAALVSSTAAANAGFGQITAMCSDGSSLFAGDQSAHKIFTIK